MGKICLTSEGMRLFNKATIEIPWPELAEKFQKSGFKGITGQGLWHMSKGHAVPESRVHAACKVLKLDLPVIEPDKKRNFSNGNKKKSKRSLPTKSLIGIDQLFARRVRKNIPDSEDVSDELINQILYEAVILLDLFE